MQVIPPNFHLKSHIVWPFTVMTLMVLAAFAIGMLISRPLPWILREFIVVVLVLGALILWFWLAFFVNIFPGIENG